MTGIACVSGNEYVACSFKYAIVDETDLKIEQFWGSFDELLESLSNNEGVFSEDNEYIDAYRLIVDFFIANESLEGCFFSDKPANVRKVCESLKKYSLYEKYVARFIDKATPFEKIQLYFLEGLSVDTLNELMSDNNVKRSPHLVEYINKVIRDDIRSNLKDRDNMKDNGLSL